MKLEAVSKRHGRGEWVLSDVHLTVRAAEIVAFRGDNGSGKSTLLRLLAGLSRPTRGRITGRPLCVGYVPDRFGPPGRLSALAYLVHLGRVRGLSTDAAAARGRRLLERLSLVGGEGAQLQTLSKGNAQKVALAQALLVPPELLILDEPWSGLDASAHDVLAEVITEVAEAGGAVVFTDHRESVSRARATATYAVRQGRVTALPAVAELSTGRPAAETRPHAEVGPATEVVLTPRAGGPSARPLDWTAVGALSHAVRGPDTVLRVDPAHCDTLLLTALRSGWSVVAVTHEGTRTPTRPGPGGGPR
ncbi:ATP-binding cassette domain-containing protein [Streptomyces sp. NPDC059816]|uniref:ATP-binding cassette domain-containing protein n=1 Tax=Streptomyces sp. NPDC059816 TaxID=3346960 RepID=UPI003666B832